MANQEHLDILKQGVEVWDTWRKQHPEIRPDLRGAILNSAILSGADLRSSYLNSAKLINTELIGADLSGADLNHAILSGCSLSGANLKGANLSFADFSDTDLSFANLRSTSTIWTVFGNVDLRTVKGLDAVKHKGPSTIGIDTIMRSEGDIPEVFLREAGVSDTIITYIRSLVGKPIEYYTCFISYSSKDQEFVERLYTDLQSKGVRCWFAPEDLKTGDKIRDRIDQSIRIHDKLLLVLSEHSVNSAWVEFEVEAAIAKENSRNALMLFPLRLDSAVKDSPTSWAAHIRRTRNIANFSNWKQHDDYQKVLNRLLRDLKPEPENK